MGIRGTFFGLFGTWIAWASATEVSTGVTITGLLLTAIGFLVYELRTARTKKETDIAREERLSKALEDIADHQKNSQEFLEKINTHLDENFRRMWDLINNDKKKDKDETH